MSAAAWNGLVTVASLLAAGATSAAFALQPLITDDTGTQGAGGHQIELSFERQRERSGGVTTNYWTYPLVYTHGMTDALDVYAGASWQRVRSQSPDDGEGHGNPLLGLKWRAWEDPEGKLSFALRPELQFGVSADAERRNLGTGRTGYGAIAILTRETGFGAVHANLAVNRVRYSLPDNVDFHRKYLWRLSVAPVVDLDAKWKLAADFGLVTHPHQPERSTMGYAELGAIWSPSKDLDIAIGYVALLHDGERRIRTLTAGATWRFR